jgi:arabinofuranan 3-O-arabinosyltransferase
VPVVLAYLLTVDRTVRLSDALRWVGATTVLVAGVSIATVLQLRGVAPAAAENLQTTELVSTVHRSSSWTESWRGLGSWLTYFRRAQSGLGRPEAAAYFSDVPVIVATFATPVLALVGLAVVRSRARLLFGALVVSGLVLMVGPYPTSGPPPLGWLLLQVYEHWPPSVGFRSGYKAGSAFVMGTAGLLAGIITSFARRGAHSRPGPAARALFGVIVAALVLGSHPLWTGNLYVEADGFDEIPLYWEEALSHVDRLEADGRVLVLPGFARNRYRWGFVGDDIFDGLLRRPHVERQSFTQDAGTDESGDLVTALDAGVVDDRYREGSFAPVARRLGIRWVIVRNDLDWQRTGAARPSDLDPWRADPELRRIASFGRPGENVVRDDDDVARLLGEHRLPPVELYEIRGAWAPSYGLPAQPPTLLSGSGHAWARLARDGTLAAGGPVRYTASATTEQLEEDLSRGAGLLLTDTNRRRSVQVTGERNHESFTLAAGRELNRPPLDLFDVPGSQTVASYGDARSVRATTDRVVTENGYRPWARAANAFDGDRATAWIIPSVVSGVGEELEVELRDAHVLPGIRFVQPPDARRRIVRVQVVLGSWQTVTARLEDTDTYVRLPPVPIRDIRVRILEIRGLGPGRGGFSEVELGDLDLAERIQLPDDALRVADAEPGVGAALADAPVRISLERQLGVGPQASELGLRRRFRTPHRRSFELTGSLQATTDTPDGALAELAGLPAPVRATSRHRGSLDGWSAHAVDGDPATTWHAPPQQGSELALDTGRRLVSDVTVTFDESLPDGRTDASIARRISVSAGGRRESVPLAGDCVPTTVGSSRSCLRTVTVPVDAVAAEVVVTLEVVDVRSGAFGSHPVRIAEVAVDGVAASRPPDALTCVPLLEIDGATIEVELDSSPEVPFRACGPVRLGPGWHELVSAPRASGTVVGLDLRDGAAPSGPAAPVVDGADTAPTAVRGEVDAPDGGWLVVGPAYAPAWEGSVAGRDLGPAVRVNTLAGWQLPVGVSGEFRASHAGQPFWELGLASSAGAAGFSLWLAVGRSRRRQT